MLKRASLVPAVLALVACGQSDVQIADSPGTTYQHVWITVSGVAFHKQADPAPADAAWINFPLAAPVSIDLASLQNGRLAELSSLAVASGIYKSLRLTLLDRSGVLAASAQSKGLTYNDQVEYTDSGGNDTVSPLELTTPAAIIVSGTFKVAVSEVSGSPPIDLAVAFSSDRDVIHVRFSGADAFILNPRLSGVDLASVGAITGIVGGSPDLTSVRVRAEALSRDSSYHAVIRSTTPAADGSFTLSPLPAPISGTAYDVVITGPTIATVIIRDVPVTGSARATSGATSLQADAVALTPAAEFTANVTPNQPLSPAGALVHFYQTVPGSAEVPYEIAAESVDPLTGRFRDNLALSAGNLFFGTYTGGQVVTLTEATAVEGAATYQIFADANLFARSAASAKITANDGTSVVSFTLPALKVASPASAATLAGTITQASASLYDSGCLILTHDGAIVASLSLSSILAANGGGAFTLGNLPGGTSSTAFAAGLYPAYVLAWNSSDPSATLKRFDLAAPVDLTQGSVSNLVLALR